MKILVTGANGLVGSALLSQWYPGHELIPISHDSVDLLQWRHVNQMFRDYRPEAVIHLAAKVGGVQANMREPATFFMHNITMNTHMLEAARLFGCKKLVCFLSTCIFPDGLPNPMEPSMLHDGPPHDSNYGYAYAKRMLAVQCRTYNEQYDTNFVPVVPCNIYGKWDNFHRENSHVVPAMLLKFLEAKRNNTDVVLWGDGSPLREFIYSQDVADLAMKVLLDYDKKEPLILSPGKSCSIKELAQTISDSMGFKGQIVWDTTKPAGQAKKPSNNSPLRSLWPFFDFTELSVGIRKTAEWLEEAYPKVRGL